MDNIVPEKEGILRRYADRKIEEHEMKDKSERTISELKTDYKFQAIEDKLDANKDTLEKHGAILEKIESFINKYIPK